jgi:hypothetical protein
MKEKESKEQQHPLWSKDRQIVDMLLTAAPEAYNLSELARLRIRYRGFPGARDIQADLEKVLDRWQLTEEALFEKTRELHATTQVYRGQGMQKDDWS